jgi:uridine kinase
MDVRREHPVRVAIDGPDAAGKTTVGDALAAALRARGRSVVQVHGDDFHRSRAIRHRRAGEPGSRYHDAIDHDALLRDVLTPLGPAGSRRYLPSLWDLATDRRTNPPQRTAPVDAVLVLDGMYLQRPELVDHFEVRIYIDVSDDVIVRRAVARGEDVASYRARYLPAQRVYVRDARPAEHAHVLISFDEADRPALAINRIPR